MKNFILVGVVFMTFQGYSQTSTKTQPYSAGKLNQYLWSFSKNSSKPGEKALIDFDVMDNWRGFGLAAHLSVSDDGNYLAYTTNKMVYNFFKFGLFKLDSLIIQSTKNGQRTVFQSIEAGLFTADSKQYIFRDGNTLCFLQLAGMQVRKINNVISYKISRGRWIAYQLKDKSDLILRNLATGKEKLLPTITDFDFDKSGQWLVGKNSQKQLLLYNPASGTERRFAGVEDYAFATDGKSLVAKTNTNLQYINLAQSDAKNIWAIKDGTSIGSYSLDASGGQVLFTIVDSSDALNNSVGYYGQGMDKAVLKISNLTPGIPAGFAIMNVSFSDNGQYVKLLLQSKRGKASKPGNEMAGVTVWNHKDPDLQSAQRASDESTTCNAIVNVKDGKLVILESDDKKIYLMRGDFALLKKDYKSEYGDRFWEKQEDSSWMVSIRNGSNHFLPTHTNKFWFSPAGNYLVWFDAEKGYHYYSYDLHNGVIKEISANVSGNRLGYVSRQDVQKPGDGNLAAWIEGDQGALAYDNFDIWKLDLSGKSLAVNLTNGFGRTNNIVLNLFNTDHFSTDIPTVKVNETLLLRSFNTRNKETGFYKKRIGKVNNPELVYSGDYFTSKIVGCHDDNFSNDGMPPVKAKNANTWIIQRQSVNDAPNYYQTSDFKNYKKLTNYQPHLGYQWLTEELHSFKYLDGQTGQGILYKPENFDPSKKYPVIIVFYEAFSNNLHQFHAPSYIDDDVKMGQSPLWLLNNGFLVFTPDIQVAPEKFGPSAYNVIEGATQYLNKLSYVDGRLGCAAHSWSSKLGAYVYTHSPSIAATTISGCGTYNPIHSGLADDAGKSSLASFESTAQGWGNLWENKGAWLDMSAVLQADKAKGAILLLENRASTQMYQDQAFQFFNALRRLDKNAWWLDYDNGSHTLSDHKELQDYTVRYTQFLDHYLQNAPAPQWMTQGIPVRLKGIESRYELDPQGTCNAPNGEPCAICTAWNTQFKRTPEMFAKLIAEWVLDKDIADELERKQNQKRKELDKQGEVQTKQVIEMLRK